MAVFFTPRGNDEPVPTMRSSSRTIMGAERIAFLIVEDVAVLRRALVRRMSSFGRADGVGSFREAQKALKPV